MTKKSAGPRGGKVGFSVQNPEKYDFTFALKAIGLSDKLSATDKRVAVTILDHFNKRTGRCDPSRDTLSVLLTVNPRTVSRSIANITRSKLFKVFRHGGHYNCNHYQPNWQFYRALERDWKARRLAHSQRFNVPELSPMPGQDCHLTDDETVHQISPTNHIQLTSEANSSEEVKGGAANVRLDGSAPAGSPHNGLAICSGGLTSSRDAARVGAERRWSADLQKRFGRDATIYGRVVDAIDADLQERATVAEMQRHGSGIACIVQELQHRGLLDAASIKGPLI